MIFVVAARNLCAAAATMPGLVPRWTGGGVKEGVEPWR